MPNLANIPSHDELMTADVPKSPPRQSSASETSLEKACDQIHEHSHVAARVSITSRQADTPIRDLPFSSQVITPPAIGDQKALTIGNALHNVSGLQDDNRW